MTTAPVSLYPGEPPAVRWRQALPWLMLGVVGIYGIAQFSSTLAGAIFFVVYPMVAYVHPPLALMVVLASAPFPYDVSPGFIPVKFSTAEISLMLCAGVLVLKQMQGMRPARFGPLLKPAAVYLIVCVVSGFVTYRGNATTTSIAQMAVYFFAALMVFSSMVDRKQELMPALYALLAVGCFQAVLTCMEMTYSIGVHKNAAGASLAGIFIVAFELWFLAGTRRGKFLCTIVLLLIGTGLIMSLSRGAWAGAIAGCIIVMAMRRQFGALLKLTIIAAPVVMVTWSQLPDSAREYAFNFEATAHNSISHRYTNAARFMSHFEQSPIIGNGTGLRKQIDSTNIIFSTLAETGVVGLIAFASIFVVLFRMVWWTQKRVSPHDPLFTLLAVGAGLMFARLAHGMFDHYWSRGALTVAWCAAGMATLAYLTVRRREAEMLMPTDEPFSDEPAQP
jgi:hypothetical protein